jgi:epoxyqueuosine reductase
VVKDKLYQLLEFIEQNYGKRKARVFVDSAPVMDRVWAHRAGLGFVGKNTMLINRKGGSYFFIGHIVLDLVLAYESEAPEKSFCGSCTLCLQACPTQALEPYMLDARKCISYLTIEHRSELPEKYREHMNDWIFGCDICQEVCPWNRDITANQEPAFSLSEKLKSMRKKDWKALEKPLFEELFKKSAVQRTGFRGLKRNIDFIRPNRLSPTC